ncbi:MAG: Maf family nucleotide pyrophosphatase [Ferruginibacter sp.]
MQKIILASQSPRRKQLLQWAEIDFEVVVHPTDENYPPHLSAEEVAVYIARNKARSVANVREDGIPVLGADTIVVCNNEVIGKPADRNDAIRILQKLSGTKHFVITGVCICTKSREVSFADVTEVVFNDLSKEQIIFYVDKYQPFDKAGAYAIQEWIGVTGIKSISGDFYNVMGLPVNRVVKALAAW